jgi:hypothetical protein
MDLHEAAIAKITERIDNDPSDLIKKFYGQLKPRLTAEQVAFHCVDRRTYRAYHTLFYRPQSMFRTWAIEVFGGTGFNDVGERLSNLTAQTFPEFHTYLVDHLDEFWIMSRPLGAEPRLACYQYRKLVDLLIKFLPICQFAAAWNVAQVQREVLMSTAYAPLDSYTLAATASMCRDRRVPGIDDSIRASSSMSWATDDRYPKVQRYLEEVLAGRPRLHFDLQVWSADNPAAVEELMKVVAGDAKSARHGIEAKPKGITLDKVRAAVRSVLPQLDEATIDQILAACSES